MKYKDTAEKIREFNRFYLPLLSLLDKNYLNSEYSVTDARILFEISSTESCTAKALVKKLQIDKSYLSRILKKFEKDGLLFRKISADDSRIYYIELTQKGKSIVGELIEASNKKIDLLIEGFTKEDCKEIENAMRTITKIFESRGILDGNCEIQT